MGDYDNFCWRWPKSAMLSSFSVFIADFGWDTEQRVTVLDPYRLPFSIEDDDYTGRGRTLILCAFPLELKKH